MLLSDKEQNVQETTGFNNSIAARKKIILPLLLLSLFLFHEAHII